MPLSAEHGEGFAELYDALREALPDADRARSRGGRSRARACDSTTRRTAPTSTSTKPLRIAVVGRPNAGKSTLLNRILGEERLLTGPEAGITRDAIGVETRSGASRKLKLFDTAGLRKRARVEDKLEKLAAADALRAVRFAEVVVLLLDATIPFEKQDLTIADLVEREGRALVIGLNKWDLIEPTRLDLAELREEADRLLPQVRGMPVVPVSGLTGDGRRQADGGGHHGRTRPGIGASRTGKLNRWLAPRDRGDAAAGRQRPAHQDPLHDPGEGAAAAFRHLRQPARRPATATCAS